MFQRERKNEGKANFEETIAEKLSGLVTHEHSVSRSTTTKQINKNKEIAKFK